jgi:hypothetical protein
MLRSDVVRMSSAAVLLLWNVAAQSMRGAGRALRGPRSHIYIYGVYKYAPEARRPKPDQRGDVIVSAMCALSYLKPDPDDTRARVRVRICVRALRDRAAAVFH